MSIHKFLIRRFLLALLLVFPFLAFAGEEEYPYIPMLIEVSDENVDLAIADLEAQGVVIFNHRENILLACVPNQSTRRVRSMRGIDRVEISLPRIPLMNDAIKLQNADFIGKGTNLPIPYDGSGVVVGLCDNGFDAAHIQMLSDDGKTLRVKRMTVYDDYNALKYDYTTPEEILARRTDSADVWHATHVAGIMAGGGPQNDYRGLAPGADVVFSGSKLTDTAILAGCEDILEYARSVGKPCVINLSLGYFAGPRDGNSLFCRYLDMIAREAVVCVSTGNAGNSSNFLSYIVPPDQPEVRFRITGTDWIHYDIYGETQVWSSDSRPLSMSFGFYHNPADVVEIIPDFSLADHASWSVSSDPESPDYNAVFAGHFSGIIRADIGVDPRSDRFFVKFEYDCHTTEDSPEGLAAGKHWAKWNMYVGLKGEQGARIDASADGGESQLASFPGFPALGSELSVSDLCTGKYVIPVGMYNVRPSYVNLLGETVNYRTNAEPGDVSVFSSYSTLVDGRILPLTSAPGDIIISGASGATVDAGILDAGSLADMLDYDGKTCYWGAQGGTSMSCPYVAGAIATWLQADPELSVEQVIDIVRNTNAEPVKNAGDPRWGLGVFSPYQGILEVVKQVSLGYVSIDDAKARVSFSGGRGTVLNPEGQEVQISVTDLSGRTLLRQSRSEDLIVLDLSGLGSCGMVLVSVSSRTIPAVTAKVILGR